MLRAELTASTRTRVFIAPLHMYMHSLPNGLFVCVCVCVCHSWHPDRLHQYTILRAVCYHVHPCHDTTQAGIVSLSHTHTHTHTHMQVPFYSLSVLHCVAELVCRCYLWLLTSERHSKMDRMMSRTSSRTWPSSSAPSSRTMPSSLNQRSATKVMHKDVFFCLIIFLSMLALQPELQNTLLEVQIHVHVHLLEVPKQQTCMKCSYSASNQFCITVYSSYMSFA